jgi:crotonobetainyl-CoA:carnitine CoA-transferase CaiB-like acyl-CoA transferase
MLWNRNKRSVTLDLKNAADRERFLALVDDADVLIENYRTGAMERLGLGFEALSRRNPRLVYASVSGYGRTGEFATKGGFDLILQGFTGLMALTGGEKEGPHRLPIPVCDIAAGLYLSFGVVAALQARERTGKGQHVETSLFEAGLSLQLYEAAAVFATGTAPAKLGQKHRGVAPYQIFRTGTDHVTIGVAQQNFWIKFCSILGRPELTDDPRFASNANRVANIDELVPMIEAELAKQPASHWLAALEEAGVPCGVIQTTDRALFHPHAQFREMVVPVKHPVAGETRTLGVPIKMSATPAAVRTAAPLLGEHNDEILGALAPAASKTSAAD